MNEFDFNQVHNNANLVMKWPVSVIDGSSSILLLKQKTAGTLETETKIFLLFFQ